MPKGPRGEKRPADAIGLAVMIGKIATGEIDDVTVDAGRRAGGKARSESITPQRRSEIAHQAAVSRWGKASKCQD
jgi:hypothetical protein